VQIKEISELQYSASAQEHPDCTVFHLPAWLENVADFYGTEVKYLGLFEGQSLEGVCPVFVSRRFTVPLYGCPLPQHATPRLLPLIPDGSHNEALIAFDAWVKQERIVHFQLCWRDTNVSLPRGVRAEIRKNLEIKLGPTCESIWKQIKSKARNEIRYAVHRHGVKVHWINNEAFLATYDRLLDSTYRQRQGISPNYPLELYRHLFAQRKSINLRILAATHRGKVIAAAWILFDNRCCYFWDGASDHQERKRSANHLLHWEVLRWCRKNQFKVYDMIGFQGRAGAGQGIVQFKESLGACAVDYVVLYWQTTWARLAHGGYRLILRLKDRPKTVSKRVMP